MDPLTLQLSAEHEALHTRLALIKSEQSKENVETFMLEIERFRNKLKTKRHENSRKIDELRGENSLLDLMDDSLKTDHAESRAVMFRLIEERKEAQFGRSPSA